MAKQIPTALIREFNATLTENKQHAVLRFVRAQPLPDGSTHIDVAFPSEGLPMLLNMAVFLMDPSLYPDGGQKQRAVLEPKRVELGSNSDGRQTLTFEMPKGGQITFAMDDQQTEAIARGLQQWLASRPKRPTGSKTCH